MNVRDIQSILICLGISKHKVNDYLLTTVDFCSPVIGWLSNRLFAAFASVSTPIVKIGEAVAVVLAIVVVKFGKVATWNGKLKVLFAR